jgi:hypothetical protein
MAWVPTPGYTNIDKKQGKCHYEGIVNWSATWASKVTIDGREVTGLKGSYKVSHYTCKISPYIRSKGGPKPPGLRSVTITATGYGRTISKTIICTLSGKPECICTCRNK